MVGVVHDRIRAGRAGATLYMSPDVSVSTLIHEEHHGLEYALQWMRSMEWTSIADASYDGEVGKRERKVAHQLTPDKYRIVKLLDIHGPESKYEDDEVAIEDEHVFPYAGKIYDGWWTEDKVGSMTAQHSMYEFMTIVSEDVLSGTPRGVGPPTRFGPHGTNGPRWQRLESERQDRSRQNHEWYLGQLLYMTATEHGAEETIGEALNIAHDGASRVALEDSYGQRMQRTGKVPVRDLARFRDMVTQLRGRTEVFRNGDVWTMRFTPVGGSAEDAVVVSYKAPEPGRGGRAKMVGGTRFSGGERQQIRATQVEQILRDMLSSQRAVRRHGVYDRLVREAGL